MTDRFLQLRQNARFDELLIEGWRNECRYGWCLVEYVRHFFPKHPAVQGSQVLSTAWREIDSIAASLRHAVPWARSTTRMRPLFASAFPAVNEMLWNGASDADALRRLRGANVDCYKRKKDPELRLGANTTGRLTVGGPDRDKRRDWNTVKAVRS